METDSIKVLVLRGYTGAGPCIKEFLEEEIGGVEIKVVLEFQMTLSVARSFKPEVVILSGTFQEGTVDDLIEPLRNFPDHPEVIVLFLNRGIDFEKVHDAQDKGMFGGIDDVVVFDSDLEDGKWLSKKVSAASKRYRYKNG